MIDFLEKLLCLIAERWRGYGDPNESKGGDQPLAAGWILVVSASRPATLSLFNSGAVEVQIATTDSGAVGYRLSPGSRAVYDHFEGSLYAQGAGGTLNWFIMPRIRDL